jgi:DNA replication protein DnaC
MTFDNFRIQGRMGLGDLQVRSLQFAYNKAYQFAQALQGWLILVGSYGSGKTHLAAAIANQAIQAGTPTLFLTVPDLLDWLRSSFSNTDASFEQRLEEIRSIPLLVLDDLGTQTATPWAQEKLYQFINHRYTLLLPLVVTTNVALTYWTGVSPRLCRILDCLR